MTDSVSIRVQTASELPFKGDTIFLLGAAKTGKTILAASASRYAPIPLNPKVRTKTPDVLFIQLEPGGINSALEQGLDPNIIDLADVEYCLPSSDAQLFKNELMLDWRKIRP